MRNLTIVGIDPGLVNTGMVVLRVRPRQRELLVEHFVIEGDEPHAQQARRVLEDLAYDPTHTFIEAYRERGTTYGTNTKMRDLIFDFRDWFGSAKVIDNTGVKKVVTPFVLEPLGLVDFPTTHHQDLQAAARIMVYGMLKDETLNSLLYDIIDAHVLGDPWVITK